MADCTRVKKWSELQKSTRIIFNLLILGIVVLVICQLHLHFSAFPSAKEVSAVKFRSSVIVDFDLVKKQVYNMELQVKELEGIRIKALNDLIRLDEKRVNLFQELRTLSEAKAVAEKESRSYTKMVLRAKQELDLMRSIPLPEVVPNVIHVGVPRKVSLDIDLGRLPVAPGDGSLQAKCNFNVCFDFSKCSYLQSFQTYVHKPFKSDNVSLSLYKSLKGLSHSTLDSSKACMYFVILSIDDSLKPDNLSKYLAALETWNGSGLNHVVILVPGLFIFNAVTGNSCSILQRLNISRALIVSSLLCVESHRQDFDLVCPPFAVNLESGAVWRDLPLLLPIKRKYLLTFSGKFVTYAGGSSSMLEKDLTELGLSSSSVFINANCRPAGVARASGIGHWMICDDELSYVSLLLESSFHIIISDKFNAHLYDQVTWCLKYGAIPVIVVVEAVPLPFDAVIDWKKAVVFTRAARLPELIYIVETMPAEDVFQLRRHGRFLYETYLSSQTAIMQTIVSLLKSKIGLPPELVSDFKATLLNNKTSISQNLENFVSLKSRKLRSNFSDVGQSAYQVWNSIPGALFMYPTRPWEVPLPARNQFESDERALYMPIGNGRGGDGLPFGRSLGGDFRVEQFTIVMLTYDRKHILLEALERLAGMKYLNKIIIVWNHPVDPTPDIVWPDVRVPMEVIRTGRNSLNNRFLPYENIDTDAVLSMDDDIYLRHEEIEVAFRVWRENRHRIVGFPGRFHAYNSSSGSFFYNSEHSCELSMVLTGGAFFHKYYSYLYTYMVPQAVKDYVDKYMNCEDIAMNFLVSHVTQLPPLKVTSRWTFRCPGCPTALSSDDSHYVERNSCMEFFERVYGYNPLKRTQFRADSILFKTKLPAGMTKCFQFV